MSYDVAIVGTGFAGAFFLLRSLERAADNREPLRYRGLADPYQMPCANPLAVLDPAAS